MKKTISLLAVFGIILVGCSSVPAVEDTIANAQSALTNIGTSIETIVTDLKDGAATADVATQATEFATTAANKATELAGTTVDSALTAAQDAFGAVLTATEDLFTNIATTLGTITSNGTTAVNDLIGNVDVVASYNNLVDSISTFITTLPTDAQGAFDQMMTSAQGAVENAKGALGM